MFTQNILNYNLIISQIMIFGKINLQNSSGKTKKRHRLDVKEQLTGAAKQVLQSLAPLRHHDVKQPHDLPQLAPLGSH